MSNAIGVTTAPPGAPPNGKVDCGSGKLYDITVPNFELRLLSPNSDEASGAFGSTPGKVKPESLAPLSNGCLSPSAWPISWTNISLPASVMLTLPFASTCQVG